MIGRILCRLGWHKPRDFRIEQEAYEYRSFDDTVMTGFYSILAATCSRCGNDVECLERGRCRKRVSV